MNQLQARNSTKHRAYKSLVKPLGRLGLEMCLGLTIVAGVYSALHYGSSLAARNCLAAGLAVILFVYGIRLAIRSRLFRRMIFLLLVSLMVYLVCTLTSQAHLSAYLIPCVGGLIFQYWSGRGKVLDKVRDQNKNIPPAQNVE